MQKILKLLVQHSSAHANLNIQFNNNALKLILMDGGKRLFGT
jgi:hypothetical protein